MKKTLPMTGLPEGFVLTEKTTQWVNDKYPKVDIEESLERFTEWASSNGVLYADWQAGFKTCIRKGVDNGWNSIVRFKKGRVHDPKWIPVLSEVAPYGFREPQPQETPDSYRTAFNLWNNGQKRTNVVSMDVRAALKGFGT